MARSLIASVGLNRFVAQPVPGPTVGDPTNGHYAINTGNLCLVMTNLSGSSRVFTVLIPTGVDEDLTATSRTYTVPAGLTYYAYGFPESVYGSALYVNVTANDVRLSTFTMVPS